MTGLMPSFRTCLKMGLTIGLISMAGSALPAATQTSGLDSTVVEARDAARKQDRNRLAAARAVMQAAAHPLTSWVEYWDLSSRLTTAQVDEVEAFYTRWSGS